MREGERRKDHTGREEAKRRNGEKRRQTERKRGVGKEEDAWSGQDRRTNGGHRTEMASGSAFQYSTLATLGHPSLSCPPSPSPCSSASSISLSLLLAPAPRPSRSLSRSLSIHFSFRLSLPSLPCGSFPCPDRCPPSTPRSHPSRTEAQHPPLDLESFYFAPPHS